MSFVEKALNRLKTQEREMAPLGEFRGGLEADPLDPGERGSPGGVIFPEPARTGAKAHPAGKLVVLDRERLRDEGFLAPEKYLRQMADEYRRIKRPLIANAFGIGVTQVELGNLILVSSANTGEGKTHTCINLALSLAAERDRTVLLVDGDVPKPHISRLFGITDQPGLLDALGERPPSLDTLLIRTDIPRLSVLPAGTWSDHATELLASTRMRELCRELAARYPDRIILFDSPPLLATTEGQAIAAAVGQTVLVVAENLTAREDVEAALSMLDDQKPVNAILNKSRRTAAGGYYYGGYGYGAHSDATDSTTAEPARV
jgi:protein-tyrosine kinase